MKRAASASLMAASDATTSVSQTVRRHRPLRWILISLAVVVVVAALFFVPANTQSSELQVASTGAAYSNLSISHPSWVTVHFDNAGRGCMNYGMYSGMGGGMNGGQGMMFDHPCVSGGDSYSFWTWGGSYRCWASIGGGLRMAGSASMPVWVNVTSGML